MQNRVLAMSLGLASCLSSYQKERKLLCSFSGSTPAESVHRLQGSMKTEQLLCILLTGHDQSASEELLKNCADSLIQQRRSRTSAAKSRRMTLAHYKSRKRNFLTKSLDQESLRT